MAFPGLYNEVTHVPTKPTPTVPTAAVLTHLLHLLMYLVPFAVFTYLLYLLLYPSARACSISTAVQYQARTTYCYTYVLHC